MKKVIRTWSHINRIPCRRASRKITKGCLVLEGGAFRGVYGEGVTDYLMDHGINLECVIGVSAGALNGYNIVAGQIGRAARINLTYRHDPEYVGLNAIRANHGVYGFDFAFEKYDAIEPLDRDRINSGLQRFIAVATNCRSGKAEYFENGKCSSIEKAIQASASMPYVSRMVEIDGQKYLDGGSSDKIPYQWAIDQGYEKIVVITTRPVGFRKPEISRGHERLAPKVYRHYPEFAEGLMDNNHLENDQRRWLEELSRRGRVCVISPPEFINQISRLEPDMEKLGHLYYLGVEDGRKNLGKVRKYLGLDPELENGKNN